MCGMVSAKAETAPPDRQSLSIRFQSADGEFVDSPFLTVCGVPKGTPFLLGLKMERSGAEMWCEVKKDGECETVDLDWWENRLKVVCGGVDGVG